MKDTQLGVAIIGVGAMGGGMGGGMDGGGKESFEKSNVQAPKLFLFSNYMCRPAILLNVQVLVVHNSALSHAHKLLLTGRTQTFLSFFLETTLFSSAALSHTVLSG